MEHNRRYKMYLFNEKEQVPKRTQIRRAQQFGELLVNNDNLIDCLDFDQNVDDGENNNEEFISDNNLSCLENADNDSDARQQDSESEYSQTSELNLTESPLLSPSDNDDADALDHFLMEEDNLNILNDIDEFDENNQSTASEYNINLDNHYSDEDEHAPRFEQN